MLPFQAELYRAIFPHHIAQSRTVLISRADDIRPYSSNRANGFLQRSYGKLFPQSYPHNRGLRKLCRSKAWGSVNEGAHFVCVTEFTGSHNAAMANFFRITSLNRGLRKIVQDKAQGSGREGATLCTQPSERVPATRSWAIFPQSDHSMRDMAMALIFTV